MRRTRSAFLLALVPCLLPSALAQSPWLAGPRVHWEKLGPMPDAGPFVRGLQATTLDPDEVYATSSAGILRSTDRGQSWSVHRPWPNGNGPAPRLGVAPARPERMALASLPPGGVLVTHDGGASWFAPSAPSDWETAVWIEFDPVDPDTLYVAETRGLWKSVDGGHLFSLVLDADAYSASSCLRVLIDRNDRSRVYAHLSGVGMCQSEDGGATWALHATPFAGSLTSAFAIDPRDGRRLFVGGTSHHLSEDGGQTWVALSSAPPISDAVAFDPLDPDRLYLSSRSLGFAVSDDRGLTWTVSSGPGFERRGSAVLAILPSIAHAGEVLLGWWGGFSRSTDGGATFVRSNAGLAGHAVVNAVAADATDASHLVAAAGGSAYVSLDGGASWSETLAWANVNGGSMVADPVQAGRFWAGGVHLDGGRVLRSDDGGWTFHVVWEHPSVSFSHLATHPVLSDVVFGAGSGVYRSDDGGATFVDLGVPETFVWDVAVSPADPDVLYAVASPRIYASHDGGASWTSALAYPTALARDVFPDPLDPDRAWAAAPGDGLYRTDDGGLHWVRMPPDYGFGASVLAPASHPEWLVSASWLERGLLVSPDGGMTAFPLGAPLPSPPYSLGCSPTELFAGTYGHGVWALR